MTTLGGFGLPVPMELPVWVLFAREPMPDAPFWPGRRWLAAVDAVGWPIAWIVLVLSIPRDLGVVGPVAIGVAVVVALRRLHRAITRNHRYRFAFRRYLGLVGMVLLLGIVWKLLPAL